MAGFETEWPDHESVSVVLDQGPVNSLTVAELGILYRLVEFVAHQGVNGHYRIASPDPRIEASTAMFCRLARCTPREWNKAKKAVAQFFEDDGQFWRLRCPEFVRLTKSEPSRKPIATDARQIARREGDRCTYCGATDGPFHIDHIYPVAKGGKNDPSNLTLACVDCNLSKRDYTLAEWIARCTVKVGA